MAFNDKRTRSLKWLTGIALVDADDPLPMMACASKSTLRVAGRDESAAGVCVEVIHRGRSGLRMIFNDDHGMMPTVTIVNQTDGTVALRAVCPSVLATEKGTYDLNALLASGPRLIEPGFPLVIRITDIGRNLDEPFRIGSASPDANAAEPAPDADDTPRNPGVADTDDAACCSACRSAG